MMQLMVSVLNGSEARQAAAGGADILDVKNPAEGSLGAQSPRLIQEVRTQAPRPAIVSAAIGDAPNLPGTLSLAALGAAVCGVDYVKVGLYGPKSEAEAVFLLREVQQALKNYPQVRLIAAGYGDAGRAGTLAPELLPRIARSAGAAGCLLDTFIKDGRSLFDFLPPNRLKSLAEEAHAGGLLFALAGSLGEADLGLARDLGADVVGLHSAVCVDNRRTGTLDSERVRRLKRVIRRLAPVCQPPARAGQTG